MNSTQDRISVTPELTTTVILPETPECELEAPFDNEADVKDGALVYNCSVMIPNELSWEDVTVKQLYDTTNREPLQFYFVYNYDGTPESYTQYDLSITGLEEDASGNPIPYNQIANLSGMVVDQDPKTSRGTLLSVRFPNEA